MHKKRKEKRFSSFVDDMIVHEQAKRTTNKYLFIYLFTYLIRKFNKYAGYKINIPN